MSDGLDFNVSIKGIEELVAKLNASTSRKVFRQSLKASGEKIVGWIRLNRFIMGGLGGKKAQPDILTSRTGNLRRSVVSGTPDLSGDIWSEKIGSNLDYAPIHEFGGTIHRYPRTSLVEMKRRLSNKSVQVGGYGKYSLGSKGQFIGKEKNYINIAGYGNQRVIRRGFTFKEYDINIPARPFLRPAINDENKQMVLDILTFNINSALISPSEWGGA